MRARYYDSVTGRFVSRDPVKSIEPRSINPYQYALGNPLAYLDPSGQDPSQQPIPTPLLPPRQVKPYLGVLPYWEVLKETFKSGEAYQSFAQACASAVNFMSLGIYGDPEQRAQELAALGYKRPESNTEWWIRGTGKVVIGLPLMLAVGWGTGKLLGPYIRRIPTLRGIPDYVITGLFFLDDIYICGNTLWNIISWLWECLTPSPSWRETPIKLVPVPAPLTTHQRCGKTWHNPPYY